MNDTIYSGIGNDTIYGNGGDDILYGEDGNDILFGGLGNDEIWGDAGDDTFVLVRGKGKETIEDFTLGQDKFGCAGGLRYASTVLGITDVAGGALIRDKVTNLDVALVKNVTAASLSQSTNFRLM
jgi:Ca2+-binding RTX toxin-like protein